jgi:hypothetical protein
MALFRLALEKKLRRDSDNVISTLSSRDTRSAGAGRKSWTSRIRLISPAVYLTVLLLIDAFCWTSGAKRGLRKLAFYGDYSKARNSVTVIPAWAMIPRKVPRLRSPLCTGTVTLHAGSVG